MSADGPIFHKFNVARTDGAERDPGSKHYGGCRLFVLDIDHDPAAAAALRAYAAAIRSTHPVLATDVEALAAAAVES